MSSLPRSAKAAPQDNERAVSWNRFDADSERDWCELIRDIAALANSGGGQIVVPVAIDRDAIVRQFQQYADAECPVDMVQPLDSPSPSSMISVAPALFPVGFSRPAGCPPAGSVAGAEWVFSAGSFYFRHGDRSEPSTTADLRAFIERLMRRTRRRWLRGIRRVLARPLILDESAAPKRLSPERVRLERTVLQPVRIVSDPNAPALQPQDVERLYPWRQKDLLGELNRRLGGRRLNAYDIQAVRRHHRLDERPDFVFNLPGAGRRYSPAVADWLMAQYARDAEFFQMARRADQHLLRLRRKKPR